MQMNCPTINSSFRRSSRPLIPWTSQAPSTSKNSRHRTIHIQSIVLVAKHIIHLCTHIVENSTRLVVALVVSLHSSATKSAPWMAQVVAGGGSFFAVHGSLFAVGGSFFRAGYFHSGSKFAYSFLLTLELTRFPY